MDLTNAAQYLKKCLSINPKYVQGLVSMGNLLFESGNSKHAIKYHLQALKINPNELQGLIGLGNAYYDMQEYEDSVNYFV